MGTGPAAEDAAVLLETQNWLERAVIGLSLCPFAKAVHVKNQIRYVVSAATTPEALLSDLCAELSALASADADAVDTTLLIAPRVLRDFLDYNDFLEIADAALEELELAGTLQIASFHPDYRFAGTDVDDAANCTNRSPHPMLHLLREASVDRAVEAYPDASRIFEKNIQTLRGIGQDGYLRVLRGERE